MTAVIEVEDLSKHYGTTTALDGVDIRLEKDVIHGLLGRNGAGKTTLMSILTAQNFATTGSVRIFGEDPFENPRVLSRMCFVREGQVYPDTAKPAHAFAAARLFFPNWDQDLCDALIAEFELPMNRRIKKLSRGQHSAVGVIIGLASRAEITVFDEPYLGLDAVARQIFYDRLLKDYSVHPRTIILSSHLIDEVADLLEHVLVIDSGRIVVDAPSEELRTRAVTVVGDGAAVEAFAVDRTVLHRDTLGRTTSATVLGELTDADRRELAEAGLDVAPVSLQQLIVRLTQPAPAGGRTETEALR